MSAITVRSANLFAFLIACGLIGFAYYLQLVLGLEPCPLCIVERFIFAMIAVVLLIAVVHHPGLKGQKIYGIIVLILAILGLVFAGRHIWLQGQPNAAGQICLPGLGYILSSMPLSQALRILFLGTSDCAKVDWSFLGLTIAGWTFLFFDVYALYALCLIKNIFSRQKASS